MILRQLNMPTGDAFSHTERETFRASTQALLVFSETLVTLGEKRGRLGSCSVVESWNRNVSSADLGIWVVLRGGGEVSDQNDGRCLKHTR